MKIILVGGHLSPLLSLLDLLLKEKNEIMVIGRKYGFEGDTAVSLEHKEVQKRGVSFFAITTGRLQRKFTSHTLFSLLKFPIGLVQSLLVLSKFRPNVVVSFGGYVSLPVVFASYILGIPLVIHEQTLEAGLANKIAVIFAKKICISFESSKKFFPQKKTVLTGNPVREFGIQNLEFRIREKSLPIIYVTGGSSGSHIINLAVEESIEKLLEKFVIIHQTGDAQEFKDFERLNRFREKLKPNLKKRYILKQFFDQGEVGWILKNADLVISRSGINTVTELLYFGKPSLLIPLPFSQNNEQMKNALFLKKEGWAEILPQDSLNSKTLCQKIKSMIEGENKYLKNRGKTKQSVRSSAALKIKEVIEKASL